jgi:hypothetical protein
MQRRSLVAVLLILPLSVFLWLIGWILSWTGSHGIAVKPKRLSDPNDLTFMVLMPQKQDVTQR